MIRDEEESQRIYGLKLVNNPLLQLPIPQSKKELKLIFMSGIDYRKIQNKGVVIENEYYNSKDLMELRANLINEVKHEKKIGSVKVRYDLADMRSVYVYDKFKKYIFKQITHLLKERKFPRIYLFICLS